MQDGSTLLELKHGLDRGSTPLTSTCNKKQNRSFRGCLVSTGYELEERATGQATALSRAKTLNDNNYMSFATSYAVAA